MDCMWHEEKEEVKCVTPRFLGLRSWRVKSTFTKMERTEMIPLWVGWVRGLDREFKFQMLFIYSNRLKMSGLKINFAILLYKNGN